MGDVIRPRFTPSPALLAVALLLPAAVGLAAPAAGVAGAPGPLDLALGIFAGAMTSTPALAAASEALPAGGERVAVGYGLAYPFGVVAVVLFVQLLPRLLHQTIQQLEQQAGPTEDDKGRVIHRLVEVVNPAVDGRRLGEPSFIAEANCLVSRVLQGDELVPLPAGHRVALGQHLLLVGRESDLEGVVQALGRTSPRGDCRLETERHTMRVVVTSRNVVGRTLAELRLRSTHGVTVARYTRHGLELVPRADTPLNYGVSLRVVGEPEALERFARFAGHPEKAYDETDIISVAVGVTAGVLLGMVSFGFGSSSFSLGLAGGPLLVALVLGHFGKVGPIQGHLPRASRMLMQELGLVFFLAGAGVKAGGGLVAVLSEHSGGLVAGAAVVAFFPLLVGFPLARYLLGLDLLQAMGGICGAMTSTPGLGVITDRTDHEGPVIAYAGVYPLALILVTVCARALALALG